MVAEFFSRRPNVFAKLSKNHGESWQHGSTCLERRKILENSAVRSILQVALARGPLISSQIFRDIKQK
jgi:hypothetical protein